MSANTPFAVVAGHICLDVIPCFPQTGMTDLSALLVPGKLIEVGKAQMATGGTVSNTGQALHKLGIHTRLIGKVGNDSFGKEVINQIASVSPDLASGMVTSPGEQTSYTIVINPPGIDRVFLHCPGTNDTFGPDDIDYSMLREATLFHFGYPPLMRRMYENNGAELESIFAQAKATGVTTSLDLARPDPDSDAGRANWEAILKRCLRHVDVFTPSADELLYMLDRPSFEKLEKGTLDQMQMQTSIAQMAKRCIEWGAAVVLVKNGSAGCSIYTTSSSDRITNAGRALTRRNGWCNIELTSTCYEVKAVGTTGAGDSTIAGFLAAILKGCTPAEAVDMAVATGASCVEAPDATSGIPDWNMLKERIENGWRKCEPDARAGILR